MPLIKSKSKKAIGKNIKTEMASGKSQKQSIAIALDVARKSGAKILKKKKEITSILGESLQPFRMLCRKGKYP